MSQTLTEELHAVALLARISDAIDELVQQARRRQLRPYRNPALSNQADIAAAHRTGLDWLYAQNPDTSDAWLHLYDEPDGGAEGKPALSFWVPAGGALDESWAREITFRNGITVLATSSLAGTGAPGTPLLIQLGYS